MTRERYEAFTIPEVEGVQTGVDITEGGDGPPILHGYAVVWGAVSGPRSDGFRHRFDRGSVVWAPVVNALWHHLASVPLASTANKTLVITEDDIGARVEITLDDTTDGIDALKRVKSRLVRGMSFSGIRNVTDFAPTMDPSVIRITRLVADDVTLTAIPAMVETAVVVANSKNLATEMKERARKDANSKLNMFKLAMTRPSRGR